MPLIPALQAKAGRCLLEFSLVFRARSKTAWEPSLRGWAGICLGREKLPARQRGRVLAKWKHCRTAGEQ